MRISMIKNFNITKNIISKLHLKCWYRLFYRKYYRHSNRANFKYFNINVKDYSREVIY